MIISCGSGTEDQSVREEARNSLNVPENVVPPASTPAISNPVANTGGVQHYICNNNCAGSGGATAGTCPVCGEAYVHNQAYHNQGAPATTITPPGGVTAPGAVTPPATPAAAQNAAGVYHYTCSAGCAGGAASAVACATCGQTLVHNQGFHN